MFFFLRVCWSDVAILFYFFSFDSWSGQKQLWLYNWKWECLRYVVRKQDCANCVLDPIRFYFRKNHFFVLANASGILGLKLIEELPFPPYYGIYKQCRDSIDYEFAHSLGLILARFHFKKKKKKVFLARWAFVRTSSRQHWSQPISSRHPLVPCPGVPHCLISLLVLVCIDLVHCRLVSTYPCSSRCLMFCFLVT